MNKADLLKSALDAVTDRGQAYGDTKRNFKQIADFWSLHLRNAHGMSVELTSSDVSSMMVLLKIARLAHTPDHLDSWVDVAGYAACGADVFHTDKITEIMQPLAKPVK